MNVAMPLSDSRENRIPHSRSNQNGGGEYGLAPVADSATLWRVVTPEGEVVEDLDLSAAYPQSFPEFLVKRDVGVVLCSGITPLLVRLFRLKGIEVVWGITGTPESALDHWQSVGQAPEQWGGRRRRGRRCRHGHTFRR